MPRTFALGTWTRARKAATQAVMWLPSARRRKSQANGPASGVVIPLPPNLRADGKPASIGRPGLSAKQPERMFLQVVDRRSAEQCNGNEFGRERRHAKDSGQCRLHIRAQARAHHQRNDQPRKVTTGDKTAPMAKRQRNVSGSRGILLIAAASI
jgi:hypothetical protein